MSVGPLGEGGSYMAFSLISKLITLISYAEIVAERRAKVVFLLSFDFI